MRTVPRYVEMMASSGHIKPLVPPKQRVSKAKRVDVYYNLHHKTFSIRHKGIVIGHSDRVTIKNPEYVVQEKGRQRVLKERSKNVHAFVRGILVDDKTMRDHYGWLKPMPRSVSYNPYKSASFRDTITGEVVRKSDWASLVKREDTPPKIWSY